MPISLPTDIADLSLWLRADSLSLLDGNVVSTWTDESSNARSFTETGSAQPTYQTNELNGKPVVRFDGTNDRLVSGSFNALGGLLSADGLESTCFVVMKQSGAVAQNCAIRWAEITGPSSYSHYYTYDDVLYFDSGVVASGSRISSAQPGGWDDAWHIVESFRDNANAALKSDGVSLASSGAMSSGVISGSGPVYVGSGGITEFFGGDIAEIVFYARGLDAGERDDVYAYLHAKYFEAAAYSITASVGSFTESGQAVGLKAARKITSAVGSFTLSGQAVALTAGRKITAGVGEFILTGKAVTLTGPAFAPGLNLTVSDGSVLNLTISDGLAAGEQV